MVQYECVQSRAGTGQIRDDTEGDQMMKGFVGQSELFYPYSGDSQKPLKTFKPGKFDFPLVKTHWLYIVLNILGLNAGGGPQLTRAGKAVRRMLQCR